MCGICGAVNLSKGVSREVVDELLQGISHRGPDAQQIVAFEQVVFGHSRLSVVDLSDASSQPMWDPGRRYLLTYNGEIYNYAEVRSELIKSGYQFRSTGDTEVLLTAYMHWGEACLAKLNGMFAFAIWDSFQQTLFLARDRMGEKPLFYAQKPDGTFLFASEYDALKKSLGQSNVNVVAAAKYLLCNYNTGTETLSLDIKRLAPAHCILYSGEETVQPKKYWCLNHFFLNKSVLPYEQAMLQLSNLFDEAVRLRSSADVAVGCLVSGGLDSSSVLASLCAQSNQSTDCFSIGFEHNSFDELPHATSVAEHFGCQIYSRKMNASPELIDEIVTWMAKEPLADTSCLPMFRLSELARQRVKVCLTGDGADEIFAGYPTYKADRLANYFRPLPKSLLRTIHYFSNWFMPGSFEKLSFDYKLRKFIENVHLEPQRAHASWRSIIGVEEIHNIITPEFAREIRGADLLEDFILPDDIARQMSSLDAGLLVDCKTWLADDILVKSDRTSMAHGLELRTPFLDHRLVEFVAALPDSYKMHNGKQKVILKESQQNRLPEHIINRKKEGFNAPLSHWLSSPLCDKLKHKIGESNIHAYIKPEFIERIFNQHTQRKRDNSLKILSLSTLASHL